MQGDIGTFASVANTQYPFLWLVQVVSVPGLWGVTRLLHWFASVVVWSVRSRLDGQSLWPSLGLYATGTWLCVGLLIVFFESAISQRIRRKRVTRTTEETVAVY